MFVLILTDKLDILIKEKGINKSELSRDSEIPYTTIINFYKKGTNNVKLSTLKKLANYFNCSLDFIADDNVTDRCYGLNAKLRPKELPLAADIKELIECYQLCNAEDKEELLMLARHKMKKNKADESEYA